MILVLDLTLQLGILRLQTAKFDCQVVDLFTPPQALLLLLLHVLLASVAGAGLLLKGKSILGFFDLAQGVAELVLEHLAACIGLL